jgi:4-alpha-glucanotransferase
VLGALGLPAWSPAQIADSTARATATRTALPPLVTAQAGLKVELPVPPNRYCLTLEDGRIFDGYAEARPDGAAIPPILEPGYHRLELGGGSTIVAVAPRRPGDAGIGDFTALAGLAARAARHGAQALAISPVHAQFSADPHRFSPYAPSTRTALNVLHVAPDGGDAALESLDLVDWPAASAFRMARFRRMFAAARDDGGEAAAFDAFRRAQGERLHHHALFEALHGHFFAGGAGPWHWRDWPEAFRSPDAAGVAAFARDHADEIAFHAWLQFRADLGLAEAQAACRAAGMGIGLISDLAVGTDSGGSQCWSRKRETLIGLSVGAPPDLLQREGQNWGLTAFSPLGLAENGFASYRDMLETALAHAGGMRIDHAMGLNRLWVIPDGASGSEGAYLSFPERDLLRLIALESLRHRAIVLAEDLGTVPDGFQDRLREAAMLGMRVLWFERDGGDHFVNPAHWTPRAAAMTSTHDLPTVAGWWQGRDLDWRARLGHLAQPAEAQGARDMDRDRLWAAMQHSGAAQGERPGAHDGEAAADAACAHVGRSACELVMLPVEDALALVEQPNVPGTVDEHPNWRRRLPREVSGLLEEEPTARRLSLLRQGREAVLF